MLLRLLFLLIVSILPCSAARDAVQSSIDTLLQHQSPATNPLTDSLTRETSVSDSVKGIVEERGIAMLPSAFKGLPKKVWNWFLTRPSSTHALMCAAVPGGGQIYNKKYWKAPIVWSLGLGCTYAITRYGSLYNEYRTAYRDFMSEDPLQYESWKAFVPRGDDAKDYVGNDNIRSRLQKGTTMYRRNRDFSIILSCLVYLLTLLDVYVDAEMVDYDISPNLSMWVADPRFATPIEGSIPIVGLQYSIPF